MNTIENLEFIAANLDKIKISPGITLVAVSKRKPIEYIEAAYKWGVRDFGENYVQDAIPKILSLKHLREIRWHFIGHIQSNKIKDIIAHFDEVQSVDRMKIVLKMQNACISFDKKISVLIQVNIGKEPQKSGIFPEEVSDFLKYCKDFSRIEVKGFMCIPPADKDPTSYFQQMREIFETYKEQYKLTTLSMGMSHDYQQAIKKGATMVRIGTAIFGPRN
ncbi:MAG: YggS family pyridoxal phosphate-dependent enzyme [Candidatus Lokiarchaeota archaeon]|nr:YggS family pyridoxal phosphate-dependent enzyme [Candidatus Harpocratesius repetitus]